MKRISAFVVALVLTLSLTSCGSKDVDTEIQPDSEPTATDQPVSPTNDISSSADTHIVVLSSVQSEDGSFTHAAMIDGLLDRMEEEMGEKLTAIATGGLSPSVVPACRHEIIVDKTLLLTGLQVIYEKNV